MQDYGQVYRTGLPPLSDGWPHKCSWQGTVWIYDYNDRASFKETQYTPTPEDAMDKLVKLGNSLGVTDLRPWSGDIKSI